MKIIEQKSVSARKFRLLCLAGTIAFIAIVVGSAPSDLISITVKVKVFLVMSLFATVMYTNIVRKYADPGYGDETRTVLRTGPNRRVYPNERSVEPQHNPYFFERKE